MFVFTVEKADEIGLKRGISYRSYRAIGVQGNNSDGCDNKWSQAHNLKQRKECMWFDNILVKGFLL